jgi:hypothetical protein
MLSFIPDGLLWRSKVRVCERADRDAYQRRKTHADNGRAVNLRRAYRA